ncbi:hypothetical protein BJX70DRAFT_402734 [Aspergillus crustosus]
MESASERGSPEVEDVVIDNQGHEPTSSAESGDYGTNEQTEYVETSEGMENSEDTANSEDIVNTEDMPTSEGMGTSEASETSHGSVDMQGSDDMENDQDAESDEEMENDVDMEEEDDGGDEADDEEEDVWRPMNANHFEVLAIDPVFIALENEIDQQIANPAACRDIGMLMIDNAYQIEPASGGVCDTFLRIAQSGQTESLILFTHPFAVQWERYEAHMHERLQAVRGMMPAEEEEYHLFPQTVATAFDYALDAGFHDMANYLVQCAMMPEYAFVTDWTRNLEQGETRVLFIGRMLLSAVELSDTFHSGVLCQADIPIDMLRAPIARACRNNRRQWLDLLLRNLAGPKRHDAELIADGMIDVAPDAEVVVHRLFQNRAECLAEALGLAIQRQWDPMIRAILPHYLGIVANYPRNATCQAGQVLANATDIMYYCITRDSAFYLLGRSMPVNVHRALLRRLRYVPEDTFVDEVTIQTTVGDYRIARDVLAFHSPSIAQADREGRMMNRHQFPLHHAVSRDGMDGVMRFLYTGEFTPPAHLREQGLTRATLDYVHVVIDVATLLGFDELHRQCTETIGMIRRRLDALEAVAEEEGL